MNSLPLELLDIVAIFALPSLAAANEGSPRRQKRRRRRGPSDHLALLRSCMCKVAEWRLINYRWRNLMDNEDSTVWYHLALFLNLQPPFHLYAGGTYRDVCQYILEAEAQKKRAIVEVARRESTRPMVACGIRMMPSPPPEHPQPLVEVKLSPKTKTHIAENAKALESFLRSLNYSIAQVEQKDWSKSALLRYRMFLYLKCTNPDVWLVPTVDIEFCWLAHIFRTQTYWMDMKALGINPEHSLCLTTYGEVATFSQAVRATANLWHETFGERFPYLPSGTVTSIEIWKVETRGILEGSYMYQDKPNSFFPAMGVMVSGPPTVLNLPNISLQHQDIAADLKWFPDLQLAFEDLFSNEYYSDMHRHRNIDVFIENQVIPSYERFLDLCRRCDVESPAPPYVLDLVWHAHQLEPVLYKNDCLSLFGCEFWHNPWPHGLGKSTPQSKEFECQWKQAFGTSMADDWKFYLES